MQLKLFYFNQTIIVYNTKLTLVGTLN